MMNAMVDMIVPVYNGEKFLQECLESLEQQSYQNIHPIIIDDHSSDSSLKVIQKYQQNSKFEVTVLENDTNQGVSYSRNRALEQLKGKFVTFLDADDVLLTNHVEKLVNLIENNPSRIAVTGGGSHLKLNPKNFQRKRLYSFNDSLCELLGSRGVEGYLWNKLFYVEDIKKYQLNFIKDIFMGEDLLFVFKLAVKAHAQIIYDPKVTYYYRPNLDSAMRKNRSAEGVLKKGNNWLKTYQVLESIIDDNLNQHNNRKVFRLLDIQYYGSINDFMYDLFAVDDIKDAIRFKMEFMHWLKHDFWPTLFSKYFSTRRKIGIFKKTLQNRRDVKTNS
ncbi:glycosyltransferase family A protein [Fructilactobacillus cliffordii]|uniref:Glycosyltransferase family 2 protein n=1 Tax=Fructilactobacillus cliffordii TaxID=2940299 RepID=A0A9Q8ZTC5_9LACO|nr:glycosyltransferase family 2 protein [Fructilactobacillus cliffordii]USS88922.1 glycosyltransferase family 2 protein [Fructilactobacillus cliffordii]